VCGWAVSIRRRVQLLLRRELLIVMPHVAAGVTSAIPAVEGLQPDGGLGALTPRTQDARLGPRGISVVRLRHSCVIRCSHIALRRSARVARSRSGRPVRRLNACCWGGLRGQSRSHVRQCQQRTTSPRQLPNAMTTVPAERQKRQRVGRKTTSPSFRDDSFRCCRTIGPRPLETKCGDSAFAFSRCTVNDSAYPGNHRSRGLAERSRVTERSSVSWSA
jgi:hypothetical protein